MIENPVISVLFELSAIYIFFSVIVLFIVVAIDRCFEWRSENLKEGLKNLIGEKYTQKIYEHPAIKNLTEKSSLPSYICVERLNMVFLSIVMENKPVEKVKLQELMNEVDDQQQVKKVFEHIIYNSGENVKDFKRNLTKWFREGMKNISTQYQSKVLPWTLGITTLLILFFNVDSILFVKRRWESKALENAISKQALVMPEKGVIGLDNDNNLPLSKNSEAGKCTVVLQENILPDLKMLPLGMSEDNCPKDLLEYFRCVIGNLLTVFFCEFYYCYYSFT